MLTGNGLALTAVGSVTAYYQGQDPKNYTGWDKANSVVPQIGLIYKFIIATKDVEEGLPLLSVLDLILGIGSTVTQIGNTIEG